MQQQISQNKIVTPIQQPLQSEPLPLHAARQTMLTQPPIQASSASLQPLESLRVPETEAAAPEPPSSEALLLPSTVGHQRQSETEEYVPQQRGNYRESTSLTLVSPSAEGLARGNENTGLVTSDTAAASISHDGSELLFSASQKPKNRDL